MRLFSSIFRNRFWRFFTNFFFFSIFSSLGLAPAKGFSFALVFCGVIMGATPVRG